MALELFLEHLRNQLVSESVAIQQGDKATEQKGLQEPVQAGLPPGPDAPGVWQQIRWILDPFGFMRRAAIRYGDCFTAGPRMLNEMGNPLSVSLLYFPVLRLDLGPASPWGRFVRRRAEIDAMIFAEIEERRQAPDPSREDILSLLMSARDEEGAPPTDRELRDELMTLLVAGHETTATALTWALYWIHRLPEVRSRLLEEFSAAAGAADPGTVAGLPYLNAVGSETLRIYPVGMLTFPRVTNSSVEVGGYQLPPSTVVLGSIYLAHRRPEVYPDPESFLPQRFLERSFSPYEYLPFGGGARRCIGMAFAQYEMRLVLHSLLSTASLELAKDRQAQPIRRGLTSGASPVDLVMTAIKAGLCNQEHAP